MQKMNFNIDLGKRKEVKSTAYQWQDRALEMDKVLKFPKSKRSQLFRWVKVNQSKAEAVYRYIEERGDIKTPWRYFCFLMNKKV